MSQQRFLTYLLIISLSYFLAGCGSKSDKSTDIKSPIVKPKQTYAYKPVTSLLEQVSLDAATAQEKLIQIQLSRTAPSPFPVNELKVPSELKRPTTLIWTGPAEEAAIKLAQLVDYHFQVVGNPPAIKPIVYLNFKNSPVIKILEQIGLQSFPVGEVIVDPNIKRIEYRYLNSQTNANHE